MGGVRVCLRPDRSAEGGACGSLRRGMGVQERGVRPCPRLRVHPCAAAPRVSPRTPCVPLPTPCALPLQAAVGVDGELGSLQEEVDKVAAEVN